MTNAVASGRRFAVTTVGRFAMTSVVRVPLFVLVLLVAFAPAQATAAAVPGVLNYQGRLTDNTPQQNPVNGTPMMLFSIWDELVGGEVLWEESQPVQVTGGLFNVILGQVTPIPPAVFSGGTALYLEIRVSGETLAPRQRIAATPFANAAASANDASGMGGLPAAAWQQRIASACPAGMAVNAVAANGTVTCVQAGSPGCLSGDCRTSWNNPDSASVSPMPRSCPAGQVAMSTGPYQWGCSIICPFGAMDCDGSPNTGCEILAAADPDNCGGCGVVCSSNNIFSRTCSNGVCNGTCSGGAVDCNGNKQTDGCEIITENNVLNCGGCGLACSGNHIFRNCHNGSCNNGVCQAPWADCNNNKRTDGCEINTFTDPNNCGSCGNVCGAGTVCASGSCAPQFTGDFTSGAPSSPQCADWQAFASRLSAASTYSLVSIKGTFDPVGISCTGSMANSLCQAIRTGTQLAFVVCDGRTWTVALGCVVPGMPSAPASATRTGAASTAPPATLRPRR
jgi:hypothetical protein